MKKIIHFTVIAFMLVAAGCNQSPTKPIAQIPAGDLQTTMQLLQTITAPGYSLKDVLADLHGYSFKPGYQLPAVDTILEFSNIKRSGGYIAFNYKKGFTSISIKLPVADTITLQNLQQQFGNYYLSPVAAKDPAYHFSYTNPSTKKKAILFLWSSHIAVIEKKQIDTSVLVPNNNLRVLDLEIRSVEDN